MTQTDYEQKKCECFEEFCKRYRIEEPSEQNIESFNWIFDRAYAYALGKQEKDAEKSKEKLMCLRDRTKVCNRRHACDIDTDAWHSMYSR